MYSKNNAFLFLVLMLLTLKPVSFLVVFYNGFLFLCVAAFYMLLSFEKTARIARYLL